jgi:hypothetical protein
MGHAEVRRATREAADRVREAIEASRSVTGHRAAMARGQLEAALESLSRAASFMDEKTSGTWEVPK